MPPDRKKLLQDFYAKYAPQEQLSDERMAAIDQKYGDDNETLVKDLYTKYAPKEELTPERYDAIATKYELKKKELPAPGINGGPKPSDTGFIQSTKSETEKKIEEGLRLRPDAIRSAEEPQQVVQAPGFDRPALHQAFIPKPVIEKNAKDSGLKQHLEAEYKKSIDNGIPAYEHFAGQFNKAVVDALASIPKTVAIVGKQIDDKLGLNTASGDKANVENYTTYKMGQWLQDTAKELGFTNTNPALAENFWATAVPQGLGSVAAIVMSGVTREAATVPLQMMGKESYLTATKQMVNVLKSPALVTGGTMMGVPEYEQAKKAGADDDTAFKTFLQNYVIGMTDAIPIGRAFDRLNKLTDHSLVKVLKNGFQGGAEEFIQEGVQNYLTNLTARDYYDKSRDLFEGMATDAGAGFVVGFLLSAIGGGAAHLPKADREKVDKFVAEKEKEYHQAFGGTITDDHISKPEQNIVAPQGDLGQPQEQVQPKPEEHALSIQKPGEVHVQPTPGNSQALEQGESKPGHEVVAGAQGGQAETSGTQNQSPISAPQRKSGKRKIKANKTEQSSEVNKTEEEVVDKKEVAINPETGKQKLFVYGTLKESGVRKKAIGEDIKAEPAIAPNEEKHDIKSFPEIEHDQGHDLKGEVLEVTPEQLKKLDNWEQRYERSRIKLSNGEEAFVYKLRPEQVKKKVSKSGVEIGDKVDFLGHDGSQKHGEIISYDNGRYKIKTDNGTVWRVGAENVGADALASKGSSPLSRFESRITTGEGKPFKLHQEVVAIIKKYNPNSTLGQDYVTSGSRGSFYTRSGNIRLKGLNDVGVAIHELTHALDQRNNVISDLIKNTKDGDKIRKALTDVYVKHYPKANKNTDLRTRMVEGYATLIQKYIESPTEIKKNYPELVKELIEPGGRHSFADMKEFLGDAEAIVTRYQQLAPLDKIGARVVDDIEEDKETGFLNKYDKVTQELFDALAPIEKLAQVQGKQMTQDDVSLWMRLSNNAMQLAQKNISSSRPEFWTMDTKGEWHKKLDYNFNTLVKDLDKRGLTTDFSHYLVARRIREEYRELGEINDKLGDQNLPPEDRKQLEDQRDQLDKILKSDGIGEDEAKEAYDVGKKIFKEDAKLFDALVSEGLEFMHNPMVQLLDDEAYDKMKAKKGYAPFKRQQYDELVGDVEMPSVSPGPGKTKVGSFMQRRGSSKPIINPLVSAMNNHAEILRKGMRQMVYNKFLESVTGNPELFQELALESGPDGGYPQEKNPDILMARRDYKRVPILVSKEIKSVIDENYQYHNMHMLEQVGTSMSQMFRTGTTGIFWQFFINNTFLDQVAATQNTRNGMMPFISSIKQAGPAMLNVATERLFGKALLYPKSVEAAYLKEYLFLAGSAQTFLSADITSQKNLEKMIFGKPKAMKQKIADYFSSIINLLSIPGNVTEIGTRATEYILARKAGKSQVVAIEEAGRVSAPFHHSGRLGGPVGKSYVRSVPYFNSSLQVLRQTKRALDTPEGRRRYAFTALSMIAASAGSMLYILGKDDDDEQKKLLRTLAPDELSKYLYFPNPYSSKRLIKVRIPEQLGWLSAMTNMALIQGSDQTDYKWSEWGEAAGSFLPTQLNPFNPTQALFSYVPPAIKTVGENMVGIKTFPAVRPIETEHDKRLPAELRFNKYTSPVAVSLGETLGLSPKKIDHLLEGVFGRSIKYLTGKSGTYGVDQIFAKEMYFEASRQIQLYYTVKERNDRQMKAYEDELKTYSSEEVKKMEDRAELLGEIEAEFEDYKDIDLEKQPQLATAVRNTIFDLIRELEKLEE